MLSRISALLTVFAIKCSCRVRGLKSNCWGSKYRFQKQLWEERTLVPEAAMRGAASREEHTSCISLEWRPRFNKTGPVRWEPGRRHPCLLNILIIKMYFFLRTQLPTSRLPRHQRRGINRGECFFHQSLMVWV